MRYSPVDDRSQLETAPSHLLTDNSTDESTDENTQAIDRILHAANLQYSVKFHLSRLQRPTELTPSLIKNYIRQFHLHVLQDSRREADRFLQSALQLFVSQGDDRRSIVDDRNPILCYLLGFEIIVMLFEMSWQQHERLYYLQHNQEYFFHQYIKPIQIAHRLNDKIVPRDAKRFFAKRTYFIQRPFLRPQQLRAIAIATFPAEIILRLGFEVIRHPRSFVFDNSLIFDEPEMAMNG
jgi:hypothetical protein